MKDNYKSNLWVKSLQSNSFGSSPVLFFVTFFLMFLFSAEIVGQTDPTLTWQDSYDLDRINVKFVDILNIEAKTKRIILAVDINPEGEKFVLTFGDGIKRVDANGNLIDFISGNYFTSPLDFAINSEGKFYVPDNASLERRINVFSPEGNYLAAETIGDGNYGTGRNNFKGPLSVAFDSQDNLYVADYYTGNDNSATDKSHVKVYYKNGGFKEFNTVNGNPINSPYRIAADGSGNIYLADLGSGNGRLQVINLDNNGNANLIREISSSELGSPGDIEIDNYGYIYVADFGNEINITSILNAGNDPYSLIDNFDKIKNGIRDNKFDVDIFRSNGTYLKSIDNKVDLALDLALDKCGKFYINNFELTGKKGTPYFSYIDMDFNMDFDIEIYQRSPSFDDIAPAITCPANIEVTAEEGDNFAVVTFANPTATDANSVAVTQTAGLSSGSQFPIGDSNIEFTATDLCGNKSTCTFTITVNPAANQTDTEDPIIKCPDPISKNNDPGKCGAIVTFQPPTVTDNSGETIAPVRTDNTGLDSGDLFPVGSRSISYIATDSAGNSATCEFTITITDTEKPIITCPANIIENVSSGTSGKVVTYNPPAFSDNCSATITQKGGLRSGAEFPVGTTTNTFEVKDASGLTTECSFTVTIKQDAATPTFTCPDPTVVTILPLDQNCDYEEPDYSAKITNFQGFQDQPYFIQSSNRTGNTLNVKIEVYDGKNGNYVGKCEFPVTLQDQIPAIVTCLPDMIIPYSDSKSFTLTDYSNQLNISDNCSSTFNIQQAPTSGTVITDDTRVTFTVIDENYNQSGCSFNIKFYKNTDLQILNCPGDQTFEVDENCAYLIPDLASNITTNIEGAVVTQNITPNFEVHGNLTLTITAKFEDQVDTCEVKLIARDSIDPVIECPGDQNETVEAGKGFSLPNYILNAAYDDNCYIAELRQQPDVGTIIYESTEVTLSAIDGSGNTASCSFLVNITSINPDLEIKCPGTQSENLDENCEFIVPDYTSQSQANFDAAVTQSPPPGTTINSNTDITLTAKGDQGTATCTFKVKVVDAIAPIATCVGSFDLRLNANGTATLNAEDLDDNSFDACGIVFKSISQTNFSSTNMGENTVRLTVMDGAGNSDFCETTVNVLEYDENAPDFECKDSVVIQLDENGKANIKAEDLYTGNGANYQFSVEKTDFTCEDLGSNNVVLSYTDNNTQGACSVEVIVEDLIEPEVRTKNISIILDENGRASITPAMLDNGTTDNCGVNRLLLDKTDFTCDDLGENRILLRAQDESSNTGSAYALVTVLGNCDLPPTEPTGPGYIFIYPNPTDGPFAYYLPTGISLNKVEVYDMQGKYILTQEFPETTVNHTMDLTGLQNAVYVLKLFTSEGEKILRVIVY